MEAFQLQDSEDNMFDFSNDGIVKTEKQMFSLRTSFVDIEFAIDGNDDDDWFELDDFERALADEPESILYAPRLSPIASPSKLTEFTL